MEDVLDVYEMPYNPLRPVVCMDEKPYQLLGESREPLPMRKGSNQKIDSEYVREGTCSIFVFTEPPGGVRHLNIRNQRTAIDWKKRSNILQIIVIPMQIKSYWLWSIKIRTKYLHFIKNFHQKKLEE